MFRTITAGPFELVCYDDNTGRVYHTPSQMTVIENAHLIPDADTLRRLVAEWWRDPDHKTIVYHA